MWYCKFTTGTTLLHTTFTIFCVGEHTSMEHTWVPGAVPGAVPHVPGAVPGAVPWQYPGSTRVSTHTLRVYSTSVVCLRTLIAN